MLPFRLNRSFLIWIKSIWDHCRHHKRKKIRGYERSPRGFRSKNVHSERDHLALGHSGPFNIVIALKQRTQNLSLLHDWSLVLISNVCGCHNKRHLKAPTCMQNQIHSTYDIKGTYKIDMEVIYNQDYSGVVWNREISDGRRFQQT